MILDDKYIALNVSQCVSEVQIDMVQDGVINIDVTTCVTAVVEEGIFDFTFGPEFE